MLPRNLTDFIAIIEKTGTLSRIRCQVDPVLEVAAVVNQVCKGENGGKALVFENIKGSAIPVAVNLFGSSQRMNACLGVPDIEGLADRLRVELSATGESCSVRALKTCCSRSAMAPVVSDRASWQAIDSSAQGLGVLPALQSWPFDGGRYLTLGQVFTCHPESMAENCGMYRVQIVDSHTALLRCHPGSGGAHHLQAWHKTGKAMPVAIALGGIPALTWAAGVALPHDVAEANFIGYLTGSPVALSRCETSSLTVPETADIVIEGRIHPGEVSDEGPFGNHTGSYSPAAPAPVVRIESVRMKENAIYPCTVVGPPPMENGALARAAERLLLPLLQYDHPWVRDVHMPVEAIYHRAVFVNVERGNTLNLVEIKNALTSSLLCKGSKLMILLDEDVDAKKMCHVYWHLVNKMRCSKAPGSVVIDARTLPGSEEVRQADQILKLVSERWHEYGLE